MITVIAASPSVDVTYAVDAVRIGEIHRPHTTVRVAGGKGLNVARAAHRLGADVHAVAMLGGASGRWIADELARIGVPHDAVAVAAETRTCISVADSVSHTMTEVYEAAGPVSVGEWGTFLAAAGHVVAARPGWLAVSGSMPVAGAPETPWEHMTEVVKIARRHDRRIVVDAQGHMLRAAIEAGIDVVKVNAAEAAELVGASLGTGPEELAVALAREVAVGAVVTAGVEGAWAVNADGVRRLVPAPQRGQFPVGSGDCLLAGLVVGLDRGDDITGALSLATAVAVANALCPGAAEFTDDDLAALQSSIR